MECPPARKPGTLRRSSSTASLVAVVFVAITVVPAGALPDTATPTLSLDRTVRTTPFTGTTVSVKDAEGTAFVPNDPSHPNKGGTDSLWLIDDVGKSAWEIDPHTGALKSRIGKKAWESTLRLGCPAPSCTAGAERARDLSSMAYDSLTDTLYAFNGPIGRGALPAAFRLTRRADGSFFPQSFQELPSGTDHTAAAWNPGDGRLYVGAGTDLRRYDYLTNTSGPPFQVSGLSGILGLTFSDGDLFAVNSKERLVRVDWATQKVQPGWTFDLPPFDVRDSRGVEVITDPGTGNDQVYVADGYDFRSAGDPHEYAVFVFDVCCAPPG